MIQTQAVSAGAGGGVRPTGLPKAPPHHRRQGPPKTVSTAGRIIYADPRSLPSYPSGGFTPGGAAATAAATLGWSNQRPFEPLEFWRPSKTASASAAAVLATDYKMPPAWEPASDESGTKAAVLAVGSADTALRKSGFNEQVSPQDGFGNSAANLAFNADNATVKESRPTSVEARTRSYTGAAATQAFNIDRSQSMRRLEPSPPPPPDDRSLAAAKGAMAVSRPAGAANSPDKVKAVRKPSADAPTPSLNAVSGATAAHRDAAKSGPPKDGGAVPVTTLTRDMFTSHPPVRPELDEQTNNERLHQSAVEMARQMYASQQNPDFIVTTRGRRGSQEADGAKPYPYSNLQEAAYRQAQERLAKLHEEHQRNRGLQGYYAEEEEEPQTPKRRIPILANLRRQSSGDADLDSRQRSQRIRQQMTIFSTQLSKVDREKREKDRVALIAAARRNVKAQMQDMDEQLHQHTGKPNRDSRDWETRAQNAAQALHQHDDDQAGRVDVGGGMFMDASEIDAIAESRVRPVLKDLDENARTEREREANRKLAAEDRKFEAKRDVSRERERKAIMKQFNDEDKRDEKARKLQEKQDEKTRKAEAKAAKKEEKVRKKEQKAANKQEKRLRKKQKRRPQVDTAVAGTHQEPSEDPGTAREADEIEAGGAAQSDAHPVEESAAAQGAETGGADEEDAHATEEGTASAEAGAVGAAEDNDHEGEESTVSDESEAIGPAEVNPFAIRDETAGGGAETGGSAEGNPRPTEEGSAVAGAEPASPSDQEPNSPIRKMKGWFKNRFSRGRSGKAQGESQKGFVGGAALRRPDENGSGPSAGQEHQAAGGEEGSVADSNVPREEAASNPGDSVGDSAPRHSAGDSARASRDSARDSQGVSPTRSSGEAATNGGGDRNLESPQPSTDAPAQTPRDSRFREMMDR